MDEQEGLAGPVRSAHEYCCISPTSSGTAWYLVRPPGCILPASRKQSGGSLNRETGRDAMCCHFSQAL
uniref:Uncharacterized protein n=1 Tax=Sphaerodactylus townsendi TaxID=933632 RepID=A0ACB8GCD6_9SAUR